MSQSRTTKRTPIQILFEYSLFLVLGAIGALVWANLDYDSHYSFFHGDLTKLVTQNRLDREAGSGHDDADHSDEKSHADGAADDSENEESKAGSADTANAGLAKSDASKSADKAHDGKHSGSEHEGEAHEGGHHAFNFYFLINDVLMALFFAIAGKEVWESLLPGGPLSNPKRAATPLLATAGGIVGPALVYIAGVFMFSDWETLGRGWAIPCATDIAFSYLVARLIFGNGHPAIAFLLLLAIADDAAGLVIIAIFYPQGPMEPVWLFATVGAMATAWVFHKKFKLHSFWWYLLIPGVLSWYSFFQAGIHPALGLVPIIPFMPHAHSDLGIFARDELKRHDTLNEFEHWWKNPVEIVLGLFGLCNAGVAFSSAGTATWLVLAGLLIGKPVGIALFTFVSEKLLKLEVPKGMGYREIVTLGCIAGIGFTVALFVSGSAFTPADGPVLDAAKMGALASFGAAILSFIVAKMLGVRTWEQTHPDSGDKPDGDSAAQDQTEAAHVTV